MGGCRGKDKTDTGVDKGAKNEHVGNVFLGSAQEKLEGLF